jgi:hypothetical protein
MNIMQRYRISIMAIVGLLALLLIGALAGLGGTSSRAEEGQALLQMPDFPPTPTVPPAPPQRQVVGGAPILFTDSFATSDALANWQIVDVQPALPGEESVWRVADGILLQDRTARANNPDFRDTLAVTGSTSWADYTISAGAYDSASATMGLVVRYQATGFYRFRMFSTSTEGDHTYVLERVVNGEITQLAVSDAPGYEHNRWYTLALSAKGSQLEASVDGTVVLQATDATLTNGQAGVTTIAFGAVRFDDVTVTAK